MNVVTKEEYLSSAKMNLQTRNDLSTSEHFRGSNPCAFFIPWIYAIVCIVIIPAITNTSDSKKVF